VDILHLEQLWSGWLGLPYAARALLNIHYLFEIDLAERKAGSLKEFVLERRSDAAGRKLVKQFPHLCTLSSRLAQHLQAMSPKSQLDVVPVGLDLSLYPYASSPAKQRPVLGLIGSFDWQPTYSAGTRLFTRLWPEIKRRVPEALLQVTGRNACEAFARFADLPDVQIQQNVPDILPYFRNLDVLLYAPGHGSGMKVKIMEALALGVPVVTNHEGVEGLAAIDGVHADIRESDQALIDAAVRLLRDETAREPRRRAGREFMLERYSPEPVVDALECVYQGIMRANTPWRRVAAS
jgi:glycosyltransferase involved in cell wall biosynthesis